MQSSDTGTRSQTWELSNTDNDEATYIHSKNYMYILPRQMYVLDYYSYTKEAKIAR